MNLEINVSCPNLNKNPIDCSEKLSQFINNKREWCIIKLSPQTDIKQIDQYYKSGFRQFHCSNTLPILNKGGLSGISLIPYTSSLINKIKNKYPDTTLIAGGGIRNLDTMKLYSDKGANHHSISTLCFNPIQLSYFLINYYINSQK